MLLCLARRFLYAFQHPTTSLFENENPVTPLFTTHPKFAPVTPLVATHPKIASVSPLVATHFPNFHSRLHFVTPPPQLPPLHPRGSSVSLKIPPSCFAPKCC